MSLQSGFCESIELMRSISTQLERQAESQNRLIQSVPEALSAIRQNMNLAEIQDRKMIETMSQLNNTLSEMHQSELQSRHYFREMFQQSEKRFQIVALLLVVLAVASMLTSVYF
jgi:sensor domain CHASE-containing protein